MLVYYSITIIINIPQGLDIDPLRLLLACVIVYTTGSFCTLITLITKSPIKSLIVSFVTINVTGFFALLSVNIFKNGYLANYFTVMAFANALAAKDFIENYAVTFLIYLLFGILFLLLGVKYFMECDIWK
ncbi:MAG: hypothetical protein LBL98_05625 [Ruminococcus sp.]|nr:hypothetical protein [Ruminococcus sp.]